MVAQSKSRSKAWAYAEGWTSSRHMGISNTTDATLVNSWNSAGLKWKERKTKYYLEIFILLKMNQAFQTKVNTLVCLLYSRLVAAYVQLAIYKLSAAWNTQNKITYRQHTHILTLIANIFNISTYTRKLATKIIFKTWRIYKTLTNSPKVYTKRNH